MNDSSKKLLIRAVTEFVALAMILLIVKTMIYSKIDAMLIAELEGAVAQQSQSISQALNGRFQETLGELQTRAMLFRQGRLSAEESLDRATMGANSGISRGILRQNASVIAGEQLPEDLTKYLDRTFAGERAVTYIHGRGLLFAVPFDYDDQICIYYEFLNDLAVKKVFFCKILPTIKFYFLTAHILKSLATKLNISTKCWLNLKVCLLNWASQIRFTMKI